MPSGATLQSAQANCDSREAIAPFVSSFTSFKRVFIDGNESDELWCTMGGAFGSLYSTSDGFKTTFVNCQDMCTKFVSPIQCEYERIIGSRKGHYDKDGCKMINDFNGLIKTLPELKDTTLAELNRFKKTLDPLVQRISKFCDSSRGLIVSVQKDVEAFGNCFDPATLCTPLSETWLQLQLSFQHI